MRRSSVAFNDVDAMRRPIAGTALTLRDSIRRRPDSDMVHGDGSTIVDLGCNNVHENITLTEVTTHPPGFRHCELPLTPFQVQEQSADSMNLVACDALPPGDPAHDAIGNWRVVDLPDVASLSGPLDRAVFESLEPLFSDGFED